MGKKHLIPEEIWKNMNSKIRKWDNILLIEFIRFVSLMASEGCFFVDIDLDFLFDMEEHNDPKIIMCFAVAFISNEVS